MRYSEKAFIEKMWRPWAENRGHWVYDPGGGIPYLAFIVLTRDHTFEGYLRQYRGAEGFDMPHIDLGNSFEDAKKAMEVYLTLTIRGA